MSMEANKELCRRWIREIRHKADMGAMDEFLATGFMFNYAPFGNSSF